MTLQKAIKLMEAEYERAKGLEYIYNPLAFAFYRIWRKIDREG